MFFKSFLCVNFLSFANQHFDSNFFGSFTGVSQIFLEESYGKRRRFALVKGANLLNKWRFGSDRVYSDR